MGEWFSMTNFPWVPRIWWHFMLQWRDSYVKHKWSTVVKKIQKKWLFPDSINISGKICVLLGNVKLRAFSPTPHSDQQPCSPLQPFLCACLIFFIFPSNFLFKEFNPTKEWRKIHLHPALLASLALTTVLWRGSWMCSTATEGPPLILRCVLWRDVTVLHLQTPKLS